MRFRAAVAAVLSIGVIPAAYGQDPCTPWTMSTVAEGLGRVENLEPDGKGGMLISVGERSAVERLTRDGGKTTAVADISNPGGLHVEGRTLYAVAGVDAADGLFDRPDGTLEKIDLVSGERTTYSDGLTAPNGLAFDSEGNAYVSRDVGSPSTNDDPVHGIGDNMYVTKIPAATPLDPDTQWADLDDTNGLVVDQTNTWLYAATTFNMEARVFRILLADPTVIELVAELGSVPTDPVNGLDDLTMGKDGLLYITANGMGRVWSLDPTTGARCIIAAGLSNPTAAKFGGDKDWSRHHLFVSGWDGRIRELVPPG
jgi:hypothetical protein